jgi:cytochrome c553
MKMRIFDLATVFRVGSAAFILGSLSVVASAETPAERGSYLVNSIGACGNCHARDSAANRTPDLAGGLEINDAQVGLIVMPNITPDPETGIGKWTDAEVVVGLRDGKRPDGSIIGPPMPIPVYRQMSDHDAEAIAVYLLSLKPTRNALARSQYKVPLPPNYGSSSRRERDRGLPRILSEHEGELSSVKPAPVIPPLQKNCGASSPGGLAMGAG